MILKGPTTDRTEIRAWAQRHDVHPVEVMPSTVDHEPALVALLTTARIEKRTDVTGISWDYFFEKLAQLGLAVVYDDAGSNFSDVLQLEEKSAYRNPALMPRHH